MAADLADELTESQRTMLEKIARLKVSQSKTSDYHTLRKKTPNKYLDTFDSDFEFLMKKGLIRPHKKGGEVFALSKEGLILAHKILEESRNLGGIRIL